MLRKIIRTIVKEGHEIVDSLEGILEEEQARQKLLQEKFNKLLPKHPNMPKKWWFETHDIEL